MPDTAPMTTTMDRPGGPRAPERSLHQRLDALERANTVRVRRAQLKRDLKSGRCSFHALLLEPPEYVETARVFDLLLAVPKCGRVKANKILAQCRVSPSKTIGGLSERQRGELVRLVRPAAAMTTRDRLMAAYAMDEEAADAFLRPLRIRPDTRTPDLTPAQRLRLARALDARAPQLRRLRRDVASTG